jgi:predicted DNA binding CopG/RHH family protein
MANNKAPGLGKAGSKPGKTREEYARSIQEMSEFEMPLEEAARADAAVAQADKDIDEARVYIRWGAAQLRAVQRAADLAGVPYQTYIKLVLFRQAVADIAAADVAGRDVAQIAETKARARKATSALRGIAQ